MLHNTGRNSQKVETLAAWRRHFAHTTPHAAKIDAFTLGL